MTKNKEKLCDGCNNMRGCYISKDSDILHCPCTECLVKMICNDVCIKWINYELHIATVKNTRLKYEYRN
jgi:hypothetical protein